MCWGPIALAGLASVAHAAPPLTFHGSVPANTDAADDTLWDQRPQLATGGSTWIATWQVLENGRVFVARSVDRGSTWGPRFALNPGVAGGQIVSSPRVATDGRGAWVVVWHGPTGDPPRRDNDIFFSRSVDDGSTWTVPALLNANAAVDAAHDFHPRVVSNGAGTWLVVWTVQSDALPIRQFGFYIVRSTDQGATWTVPGEIPFATYGGVDDRDAELATDGKGRWIMVWHGQGSFGPGDGSEIFVSRSVDDGLTWTHPPPRLLADTAADDEDYDPHVATDGEGTWIATWMVGDELGLIDADIAFVRSLDNGLTWSTPALLNGDAFFDDFNDTGPRIAVDQVGVWRTAWESSVTVDDVRDYSLRFASSDDAGATWSMPSAVPEATGPDPTHPTFATDRDGTWMFGWGAIDGVDSDVRVAAAAACGDRMVGVHEECDHGPDANGVDGCCTSECRLRDGDADGICDSRDPCASDTDNDADADGLCSADDNCPGITNTDQSDVDVDGLGDACDEVDGALALSRITANLDGKIRVAGFTPADDLEALFESPGVALRIGHGPNALLTQVSWHRERDCATTASGIRCVSPDGASWLRLKILARSSVLRLSATIRAASREELPLAPLAVSMAYARGSSIALDVDLVGTLDRCRGSRRKITCRP
jgi:hypothetical protein